MNRIYQVLSIALIMTRFLPHQFLFFGSTAKAVVYYTRNDPFQNYKAPQAVELNLCIYEVISEFHVKLQAPPRVPRMTSELIIASIHPPPTRTPQPFPVDPVNTFFQTPCNRAVDPTWKPCFTSTSFVSFSMQISFHPPCHSSACVPCLVMFSGT